MQIVGLPCKTCERPINSILDGQHCGKCSLAFHASCTDHSPTCPLCGESFAASREAIANRESKELSRQVARGRRIALAVTWMLVLFSVLSFVRPLLAEGRLTFSIAQGGISLSLLLAVFFYLGYHWALVYLQISFLVSMAFGLTILFGSLSTGNSHQALVGLGVVLFYGFLWGLITFSPSLAVFLAYSRENRAPPS